MRSHRKHKQGQTPRRAEAGRDERAARPRERQDTPHEQQQQSSARTSSTHSSSAHTPSARTLPARTSRAHASSAHASAGAGQLYGVLPVLEALRAGGRRVEHITVAEGAHEARLHELFELARAAGVPVRRAPRAELQRLAPHANHQGVVASVAAAAYADADELLARLAARVNTDAPPLAVVLDGVEDPRNLGAIIRTCECAGADAIFVPERRAAGLTETVAKAAAGALEYVPVARAANVARLVEELKACGVWTIGTAADAPLAYTDWDWTRPSALLLGGEGEGLRRLVRERCDVLVSIPLRGRIESLNVSVAAGVVLYEALRQRADASARVRASAGAAVSVDEDEAKADLDQQADG
jgi:23S rRNA (guanosine2251-2'-O)-methyltransferase